MTVPTLELRQTPLTARHVQLGARLVPFAGWAMPVQYKSLTDEHRAVRERAGLFDISHMGECWVHGPGAGDFLAHALLTDPRTLALGRAQYSLLLAPDGGIIDDLIVYRTGEARFLVVMNAANCEPVMAALRERAAGFRVELEDASLYTALIAVQGPAAARILAQAATPNPGALRYYAIGEGSIAGVPVWIARTGYTGEDGFEIVCAWKDAVAIWDALLKIGEADGLVPCGLGARDTLRLEAGMPLYGQELDRSVRPAEAGLGRLVKADKPGDYVGRAALEAAGPPARRLVGLRITGRGIARHGYSVHQPGSEEPCGVVTSGTHSPSLGQAIAMAYVPTALAAVGTMLDVDIRGSRAACEVVELPFHRRPKPAN